jgi:hypothetical protein
MPNRTPRLHLVRTDPLPGFRAGMLLAARLVERYELEMNVEYRQRLAQHIRNELKEIEHEDEPDRNHEGPEG